MSLLQNHRMPNSKLNKTQVEIVAAQLDRIQHKYGYIKPKIVVKEAEAAASPLHNFFTWEDRDAASRWRESEARDLIRAIRIVRSDMPLSEQPIVRKYLSVSATEEETRFDGSAYLPMDEIMKNEDYQQQALNSAMDELRQWKERHDGLKEFFGVYAEIESIDRTLTMRAKIKKPKAIAK